ncbi:MAG: helix-turn-helix domain-containing protein [Lachnospiraceae bacterium]
MRENGTDTVRIDRTRRDCGFWMREAHLHRCYELYYLERGSCSFFVSGQLFSLQEGSGILIPPGVLHSTSYHGARTGAERTAMFFREQDLLDGKLWELLCGDRRLRAPSLFLLPPVFREGLESIFARMRSEAGIRDRYTETLLELGCKEVLLYLARHAAFEEDLPEQLRTGDPLVLLAARIIGAHYAEKLGSAELARACGCSESLLSARFKRATGIGVHAYLQGLRLQQAAVLLAQTKESVTDIALTCGFQSPGYFKDAFRKVYGLSPRAYRAASPSRSGSAAGMPWGSGSSVSETDG